jgi:hypothetical protein
MPFGRGRRFMNRARRVINTVLGDWRLVWISVFQSGTYFSPSFSGSDPSNPNTSGRLPDRIANGNLPPDQRTVSKWFDASAFAPPPPGRFGNSGVNILQGPGLSVQNASLIEEFKVTERWRVEYQVNALDVFNTPTLSFPNANISVPAQVGRLTTLLTPAGDPSNATTVSNRSVIMRLRIEF